MIGLIMAKLGFSGMIAVALLATLSISTIYFRSAIHLKDNKLQDQTIQIRDLSSQRDALLKANQELTISIQKQNETIDGYAKAGQVQQQRADRAVKESQDVKDRWETYLNNLPVGTDSGTIYSDIAAKWNGGK